MILSKTKTSLAIGKIKGNSKNGAISGTAIIVNENNPKITNLTATFTQEKQQVSYTLYIHNSGAKAAYLENIIYENVEGKNNTKYCYNEKKEILSCDNIFVETDINDLKVNGSTANIHDVILEAGKYFEITITIHNNENTQGELNVILGNICFVYDDK